MRIGVLGPPKHTSINHGLWKVFGQPPPKKVFRRLGVEIDSSFEESNPTPLKPKRVPFVNKGKKQPPFGREHDMKVAQPDASVWPRSMCYSPNQWASTWSIADGSLLDLVLAQEFTRKWQPSCVGKEWKAEVKNTEMSHDVLLLRKFGWNGSTLIFLGCTL